jgi:pimeloyl-ACP methyl ester carboxylesterase
MKTAHRITARITVVFALAFTALTSWPALAAPVRNIVLVHGFFADGSGWRKVADILAKDGYHVVVVQEPETSFADDVQAAKRAVDALDGNSILVGHSYGGAVITEAGADPKVAGLVYVSAFAPDSGESLKMLFTKTPPASNSIKPTPDGYLYLDPALFRGDFAPDVPAGDAAFMARSQVLPAATLIDARVTQPSWKTKPSWAVISTVDRIINPDLLRSMAKRANSKVTEIKGSHSTFIAHPAEVAKVIEQAATTAVK